MAKLEKKRRRIVVRNSSIHGRGVFALRRIPKGTRIIEYKGKLITDKEADRRYSRVHEHSPHTMLFSLEGGWVIDATRRGNSARWINHSCAPNCDIEEEGRRIFIESRRDIQPGDELTYDYNLQIGEKHTKAAKREHACFCRARRCRGTMLGEEEE
ncbi:MAG TPA: SET domain-containing protein-lysine N-methyltransferase [Candidatus Binatia bacterium]|jgi:SET domain-containing protein|nr:SET domain-containing protein-lysine N-methyltransferase [Candidatus Binatia bacterium]